MSDDRIKQERVCPVCGSANYTPFAKEKIDEEKMNTFTYASRKAPEFMCLRLVCCSHCDVIYAPTPPDNTYLTDAYTEADFDSSDEAICAAQTYAKYLAPYVKNLPHKHAAIDVGAGSGPLLPLLDQMGFEQVVGVEPSVAAIDAAAPDIKHKLRKGMFSASLVDDLNPSLICSFMTLEHIDNPNEFTKIAFELITADGMIAVVVHNRSGLLNRILGLKSPIIDVEHLQLFNPNSATVLLERSGFQKIKIISISNKYPLKYWVRLMPLPLKIKTFIIRTLGSFANKKIAMKVGNIMAIGFKPEQ